MSKNLDPLMLRAQAFLGCPYAILGGAMTWVSDPNLTASISETGAFGVLAGGAMNPSLLAEKIDETKQKTNRPFGVNLITLNPQLTELIEVCKQKKVTHLFLAGGIPSANAISQAKEGGMKVICFAPILILAKKLIRNGADALVIEGSEAGGHIGMVSTIVLIQEILLSQPDTPIFVAGGIGRGELLTHALLMGAMGIQLGTMFAATKESPAHEKFKKAFFKANAKDAQASVQLDSRFPVIPVRGLQNQGISDFNEVQRHSIEAYDSGKMELKEAQLEVEKFWVGALRRGAVDGDIEKGSVMAGQSVTFVQEEKSVQEVVDTFLEQAEEAFLNIRKQVS